MGSFLRRTRSCGQHGREAAARDHGQAAFRIVGAQLVVTALLAMTVLGWWGADLALAALAGGLICTASSAWFAMRMFRGGPQADPNKVLRAFYAGEVSKIALTAGLFAVAIIILDLDVLIMFLAYMAATAVYWFALVANVGRQR